MIDSLARGALRWASYPAQLIYNMATAAYSSFHTGAYLQNNPTVRLQDIISRWSGQFPVFNNLYSQLELVDMFGGLLDPPYSARGIVISGDNMTGTFHTAEVAAEMSSNIQGIEQHIKRLMENIEYMEGKGVFKFRLQFVLGTPVVLPMS